METKSERIERLFIEVREERIKALSQRAREKKTLTKNEFEERSC